MSALPGVLAEAKRLVQASSEKQVVLRLIGGVAVALRCPSVAENRLLQRDYVDIDFVAHETQSRAINEFFVQMGYEPRHRFNAMMGGKRLIFNDLVNTRRVDVFLDVFEMCHKFDFSQRVELEPMTLPLADLLATKLQIVEINDKDFKDMAALLLDHDVGLTDGETINGAHIAKLCANDWGIYKTFTVNLSMLANAVDVLGLASADVSTVKSRSGRLLEVIEEEPKSFAWKMRARVGEKKRWYELPEPDDSVVASE